MWTGNKVDNHKALQTKFEHDSGTEESSDRVAFSVTLSFCFFIGTGTLTARNCDATENNLVLCNNMKSSNQKTNKSMAFCGKDKFRTYITLDSKSIDEVLYFNWR